MASTSTVRARPKLKLAPAARREFLRLVDKVSSRVNVDRVIGRLQMTRFIAKHGREACDEFYAAYNEKAKARTKR